jgi:DNA-directed RNA polymerase specialized sigma24 family protein
MPVPTGIPTEQILEIIERVVGPLGHKLKFASFDSEEIKQEGRAIAWKAIVETYEEGRPLENFLRVHVRNRLLNFKRNNTKTISCGRSELVEDTAVETNDIKNKIDENLPGELRQDYLRICQGVSIPKYRKEKVLLAIREILGGDSANPPS